MPFTMLLQEQYKNDNGNDVEAAKVDVLAPYKHVIDGFYNWECGDCKKSHASRSCGWPISGQVVECQGCKKMNLLVRTNCVEIDKAFGLLINNEELQKEVKRLQGIEQFNQSQLATVREAVISRIRPQLDSMFKELLVKPE